MNRKLWFEWGDGGAGKERERRRKNEEHKYQTLLVCSKEFDQSRRICICGNTSRASIFNDSRLSNKNSLWRRRMFDISFNNIHHFLIPFRQSDESIRCTASSQNECGKIWMHDERAMTRVEEEVEEKKNTQTPYAVPKNYIIISMSEFMQNTCGSWTFKGKGRHQ